MACGRMNSFCFSSQGQSTTGGEARPNPFCYLCGTWKPRPFANTGKPTVRKADGGREQDGGKSEGHFVMKWIEVELQGDMASTGNGANIRWVSHDKRA